MQEIEDIRKMKDIQNTYVIEKRYIYVSFANWRRKFVSFAIYSAFL